ncbi:MAG: TPR repeat [Candidatus Electronema aureum]|uniref:TPR repeat n=1 Tax=Candidatus Electronema aureum TaxID=2005002 RepID=A0A521FZ37_9BACT|nr:MAG: TPR repeat [Candidatus Electronema aureum]
MFFIFCVDSKAFSSAEKECDEHSSYKEDPMKPDNIKGVKFEELNPKIAIPICDRALKEEPDNARILYQLGRLYQKKGRDNNDNDSYRKCVEYFDMAIKYSYQEAFHNMGSLYYRGEYFNKDYLKSFEFYKKSAEVKDSIHKLAYMYQKGYGVEADLVKARELYEINSQNENGYSMSMNNLGLMYEKGTGGLTVNEEKALDLWKKAAEKEENKYAYWNLCRAYQEAIAVIPDINKAKYWCRKALNKGHLGAKRAYERLQKGYLTEDEQNAKEREIKNDNSTGTPAPRVYKYSYGDEVSIFNNGSYWIGIVQERADERYQVKITTVNVKGFMKMFLSRSTCTGNETLDYNSKGKYIWIPKWCVE